jgi:uncharacterized protein
MRSWVFDTNVIVSGHLSPFGPPGRLLTEILGRRLRMSYDDRMAVEYHEVLSRPKFAFPAESVRSFLLILEDQDPVSAPPWKIKLPDPADLMFLEVASQTKDKILVSGNVRHFPTASRRDVRVMTPAEAWVEYCR